VIELKPTQRTDATLNNMASGVFFNNKIIPKIDMIGRSVEMKMAVEQLLNIEYKEKAKHFKVTLIGSNQYGFRITILADEIGWYLVKGTKPHTILPNEKKALAFETAEGGIVRDVVHHPGTEPITPSLHSIIEEARMKLRLIGR
jgi:hypothetical protein